MRFSEGVADGRPSSHAVLIDELLRLNRRIRMLESTLALALKALERDEEYESFVAELRSRITNGEE
jgi:hypothetical protein